MTRTVLVIQDEELRVLKAWAEFLAMQLGGDDSPTPNDADEEIMLGIIKKLREA